jgi:hypothetical protein
LVLSTVDELVSRSEQAAIPRQMSRVKNDGNTLLLNPVRALLKFIVIAYAP